MLLPPLDLPLPLLDLPLPLFDLPLPPFDLLLPLEGSVLILAFDAVRWEVVSGTHE